MGENLGIYKVPVWDLPTRLFHWLLVILVAGSFVTAGVGGDAMQYHVICGYCIFGLLLFRMVWGFVGGTESRFTAFLCGPGKVLTYAAGLFRKDSPRHLGHNPLGGWSVVVMLMALLVQAGAGLFINGDITIKGPLLNGWIGRETINRIIPQIHRLNPYLIAAFVAVHVSAILFYLIYKRENLIKPMFTGVKMWEGAAEPKSGSLWTAMIIAGSAALTVYLIVR